MRMIGHIQGEPLARQFSDFLFAQGIKNEFEADANNAWIIWIHSEEQVAPAIDHLNAFAQNPGDPKYRQATGGAQKFRAQEIAEQAAFERRVHTRKKTYRVGGLSALTLGLIAICVGISAFSGFGMKPALVFQKFHYLFISEYRRLGEVGIYLPEIQSGQIWRLFTPMLLHFSPLHILFNMLWLKDLGGMIENKLGWPYLLLLVLVISGTSNLGQYIVGGPQFGGMSGVVYGLFGYIWLRSKYDPFSGFFVDKQNVIMMLVWFFLCLFGVIPNVANAAHGVGLVVGCLWGFIDAKRNHSLRG